MSESRELRALVPFEIAAVLAIAFAPIPEAVPVSLPLLVVASLSRWVRGRGWGEVAGGGLDRFAIGAVVGLVALGLALIAGTPVVETLSGRGVEWSSYPVVRGNASQLVVVVIFVGVAALAAEVALRGWLVERMLELSPGPAILPVLVGAIAEAVIMPGNLAARLGAGLFGAGLGWMYVAGGRSIVAPVVARVVFTVGAVMLESLRLIG
ncbi:MAG: hypothetical protein M3619_17500 [Myxococcota bacterium]|nr:hypothetical protein [Myxococcota bacterium]